MKFRGSVDGVKQAIAAVSEIVDRERKIEEVLMVESQHIGQLLGKGGATVNMIQKTSGAGLSIAKRVENGDSAPSQAVTVRGNKAAVAKAMAGLEAVLQYKAECSEEVLVDAKMMPLLIGKGGEEINRIRQETGAAIDGERDDSKPRLKLRGTRAAVEKAKAMISEQIDANKIVTENVVLPWHAIDKLVGPNAKALISFEAQQNVTVDLPGHNLANSELCYGTFINIASSMAVRGKKKHVHQATAFVADLAMNSEVDEKVLNSDDADLLASLCLSDPQLMTELGERLGATVEFEPLSGVISTRGEASLDAQIELRRMVEKERRKEETLQCPPLQAEMLGAPDGAALCQLQQLCEPAMIALQEAGECTIAVFATAAEMPTAVKAAQSWLSENMAAEASLSIPLEVVPIVQGRLDSMQTELRVHMLLDSATRTLQMSGPSKVVEVARERVTALVRQYAHVEELLFLSAAEAQFVQLLIDRLNAPTNGSAAADGAAEAKSAAASLFQNVTPQLSIDQGGASAKLVLKGTADPVGASKAALEAQLIEAESSAVRLPLNAAQYDKLTRSGPPTRRWDSLHRRLQEGHSVALVPDRAAMELTILGAADAVARVQLTLDEELDVDEHAREVNERLIPIIIGRAGANIKKLQADSGAQVDLDRAGGRVTVRGRKAQVAAAVARLDELASEFGEKELRVLQRQIPLIIGRGGTTIRQLQQDTGASIDIRKEDCVVRIRGSQAVTDDALRRIQELLAAAAATPNPSAPPPGLQRPQGQPAPPPGLTS
uniref:K Homology domain-containing protein n=1 Tax=Haptolina brevifila TaxID=156173 RepID=A0A7S2N7G6_9EUKA|mmetsp:Transcript_68710/g.136097  ORF Transcript_68710/g.136097 Transcript_68710/m.136097 type:complete len:777 (+) Transcript_68710:1540-3870(+)